MSFITVAAATLPSVPLDFQGNRDRIIESIRIAKAMGATLRTGPELEIPGYSCLDHHLEGDTVIHSWEVLADIISDEACKEMLIDVGMGCRHRNVLYNCRILCTYKRILFIRPKMSLANDGLYRETRHFTAWPKKMQTETYYLESVIEDITGQHTVPIGDAILSTLDTAIGCETCEEMFTPSNPSTYMSLNGCEIILNSSASHAELRKLKTRIDLIANSTRKTGGCYVYANATGVDGDARMMFDGSSMVLLNGKVLEQGPQFSLQPVHVVTATIDIEEIRSFRCSMSRNVQAAAQPDYPRVEFNMRLSRPADQVFLSDTLQISRPIEPRILDPMAEIWLSTAVFLWQYLVRTNSAGFFLSLSGGLDSSTVALFVYGMAKLVLASIEAGEETTLADLRRVTGIKDFTPKSPYEIVNRLLTTCYTGTVNSSDETRSRAERLAEKLGAWHLSIPIDGVIGAYQELIKSALQFTPRYSVEGGTQAENLALQNLQARNRMVVQYTLAQLATTARKLPRAGAALLVLTSGNVDEALRGYVTKYDASAGDIAPLGSISKNDAKRFQAWARHNWDLPIMTEFIEATPTAELLPLSAGVQADESENEMGLSYEELSMFGILRKVDKLGPWSCYLRLLGLWKDGAGMGPQQIGDKVMRFYRHYAINRHKATVLTPSIHLSAYNPDDNRADLRPFLYVVNWPFQFNKIRAHAEQLERKMKQV
ncbi:NAD+ synthase (Glutamine-hydrolysing) [Tolypocladium paradoxum]|uniref:Glutamine-dependent NAD(+) synthetase n=1 Tax=Tolypocladium paradoxum TaxID=94208 RepID=A0A2S4KQL0_9HYPO|nr:NAD+ synthase (Glutamine-hydrolysing) [Tolypocladium paradoxum]